MYISYSVVINVYYKYETDCKQDIHILIACNDKHNRDKVQRYAYFLLDTIIDIA